MSRPDRSVADAPAPGATGAAPSSAFSSPATAPTAGSSGPSRRPDPSAGRGGSGKGPASSSRGRSGWLRIAGMVIATLLGIAAVWLIVTADTTKRTQIGALLGFWALLIGAYPVLGARHQPTSSAELEVRPDTRLDRLASATERRDYEEQLRQMLRHEVQSVLGAELAHLRAEVAGLRSEILDKVGGQIRLERIETRMIGSDIEALQQEVRQLKVARHAAVTPEDAAAASLMESFAAAGASTPRNERPAPPRADITVSPPDEVPVPPRAEVPAPPWVEPPAPAPTPPAAQAQAPAAQTQAPGAQAPAAQTQAPGAGARSTNTGARTHSGAGAGRHAPGCRSGQPAARRDDDSAPAAAARTAHGPGPRAGARGADSRFPGDRPGRVHSHAGHCSGRADPRTRARGHSRTPHPHPLPPRRRPHPRPGPLPPRRRLHPHPRPLLRFGTGPAGPVRRDAAVAAVHRAGAHGRGRRGRTARAPWLVQHRAAGTAPSGSGEPVGSAGSALRWCR